MSPFKTPSKQFLEWFDLNDSFLGEVKRRVSEARENCEKDITEFKLHESLAKFWELFTYANVYVDENKPWADVGDHPEHFLKTMTGLIYLIINAAKMVEPFLPETTEKIFKILGHDGESKGLEGYKFVVTKVESLFPRLK